MQHRFWQRPWRAFLRGFSAKACGQGVGRSSSDSPARPRRRRCIPRTRSRARLARALGRTVYHSVCVTGRDSFGNADFLAAALKQLPAGTEVMADTDGQRPEALAILHPFLSLIQVTHRTACRLTGTRASRGDTSRSGIPWSAHTAVTIAGTDESSDADYLQIVDQVHSGSDATSIVIHPGPTAERGVLDKRWSTLMEHASARHRDLRLLARLSGPATMR